MLEIEAGMPVRSRAGHDKGCWYLVLKVAGGNAWLIDGHTRTPEKPKKKNLKHLQPAKGHTDIEHMDAGAVTAYLKEFYKKDQEERDVHVKSRCHRD